MRALGVVELKRPGRRPGTRRLPKLGRPACSGVMRARLELRNAEMSLAMSTQAR
jgi:hypothetical protein